MRFLYLDQTAELGGAELSLFAEVTNLPYTASVLLFADGRLREMFEAANIPVEVLDSATASRQVKKGSGLGSVLLAAPAVLRLVFAVAARARKHDVIYANSQKAFVVGALAAALTGKRLVWRLRDVLDETHFSTALIRIVVRLANWKASCVIANSEATKRAFGEAGGDLSRAFVAYPGIDERPFAAVTDDQVAAMRAALGAGEAKLVGVFGRLSAWKGQDVFVEALAGVPDAVGVIVGSALFGEAAFEAALREKIMALGMQNRIRLLGFREDIPLLMRATDVVVHCSVAAEPFGRVVVEGMLAGKPVVASKAGGVMEIVEDGVTGYLVEPGCVGGITASIKSALIGGIMAEAGHKLARERFTVAATIRQIQAALSAVTDAYPNSSA
jgi:glycosyltransferase involved in cell wall biosynthesis